MRRMDVAGLRNGAGRGLLAEPRDPDPDPVPPRLWARIGQGLAGMGRGLLDPGTYRAALDPTTEGWTERGVPGLIRSVVEGLQREPIPTVTDFSPLGDAKALAYDAPNAFAEGNTGLGLLALASAIPGVPNMTRRAPMRAYHASPEPDPDRLLGGFAGGHGGSFGGAVFLNTDPESTTRFAFSGGRNVHEFVLPDNVQLFDATRATDEEVAGLLEYAAERDEYLRDWVDENGVEAATAEIRRNDLSSTPNSLMESGAMMEALTEAGYAGAIADAGGGRTIMLFEPHLLRRPTATTLTPLIEILRKYGLAGILGAGVLARTQQRNDGT